MVLFNTPKINWTDRRTDGQTDRSAVTITTLCIASNAVALYKWFQALWVLPTFGATPPRPGTRLHHPLGDFTSFQKSTPLQIFLIRPDILQPDKVNVDVFFQAFHDYYSRNHERLLTLWRTVVAFRRQFSENKSSTERDLSQVRSEIGHMSQSVQSVCVDFSTSLHNAESQKRVRRHIQFFQRKWNVSFVASDK